MVPTFSTECPFRAPRSVDAARSFQYRRLETSGSDSLDLPLLCQLGRVCWSLRARGLIVVRRNLPTNLPRGGGSQIEKTESEPTLWGLSLYLSKMTDPLLDGVDRGIAK